MKVYIGGTYDILHPGHIKLFQWARQVYGPVTIGLNRDEFVERYKGKLPVMSYDQRRVILSELRCINRVIANYGDEDSTISIGIVAPDVIVAGSDWTIERLKIQMGLTNEFLRNNKIGITIFPHSDPIHSSDIKKRI
jgi:cytidyltransferase-like protein